MGATSVDNIIRIDSGTLLTVSISILKGVSNHGDSRRHWPLASQRPMDLNVAQVGT
jgi:hypothetical protein